MLPFLFLNFIYLMCKFKIYEDKDDNGNTNVKLIIYERILSKYYFIYMRIQ